MKKIYSLVLVILLSTASVFSQTVAIGETSYGTISEAIAAASNDDVIMISGVHTESLAWADKSITLRGTDPTTDIIQADVTSGTASGRVITIADPVSPINVTIENLGIRYGNDPENGGGIAIDKNTGLVTLKNLIVSENATAKNGGGILVAGSNVDLIEVSIVNNMATLDGGGLILTPNNGAGADNSVNIKQSLIDNNSSANGGGIYINGNKTFGNDYRIYVEIENTTIANNSATSGSGAAGGGGIWSKCAFWTVNAGGDGTTGNVNLKMVHTTLYNNSHAALAKAGIQFTSDPAGALTNFSIYNSIVVAQDVVATKALNFANSNTTDVVNCILGGLNAVPAIVDAEGKNNQKGRTASQAGIASTLSNEGGSVQVLALERNDVAVDYCNPIEGVTLPTVDARGEIRDTKPDAGAYEYIRSILRVSSDVTPEQDADYDSIIVEAAGSLTIPSGTTITSNEGVVNNGALTVESGGSLVVLGTASGTATVKRNTVGNGGYSILGSPVIGASLSALEADYLYSWNGSAWTEPTGTMFNGRGYFIGYDASSPEVSITGDIANGFKVIELSTEGDKFNLVANPYAAAINISDFLSNSRNDTTTTGAIYLWDDGGANAEGDIDRGGDYIVVNELGATVTTSNLSDGVDGTKGSSRASNGKIGSMQGFFVEATATQETDLTVRSVGFTPDMQTSEASANVDGNFYRTIDTEKQILKLNFAGLGQASTIIIGLVEGATIEQDHGLDATKFSANENFSFYSKLGDKKVAIQGLPKITNEDIIVDLGTQISQTGEYTISVAQFEGFENDTRVILYDRISGESYVLGENALVKLNASSVTSFNDRFQIIFSKAAVLSAQSLESKMNVHGTADGLIIRCAVDADQNVAIYTMDGKVVYQEKATFINSKATIQARLDKNQIYILRVQNQAVKFVLN